MPERAVLLQLAVLRVDGICVLQSRSLENDEPAKNDSVNHTLRVGFIGSGDHDLRDGGFGGHPVLRQRGAVM